MPDVDCKCNGTSNCTCGHRPPCAYGCKNNVILGWFCIVCVAWFDAQQNRISNNIFGKTVCQQPGCDNQAYPFKTQDGSWCVDMCCMCYLSLLCSKCNKLEQGPYTDGVCAQCTRLKCGLCPAKLASNEKDICAACETNVLKKRGHCHCVNGDCRNRPIVHTRPRRNPAFVFCVVCHAKQTAQEDCKITCVFDVCTEPACASGYCYGHADLEEKTKPCPSTDCTKRVEWTQNTVCLLCKQKDEQAKRCEESRKAEELCRLAKNAESDYDDTNFNDGGCGYHENGGTCNGNCGCW